MHVCVSFAYSSRRVERKSRWNKTKQKIVQGITHVIAPRDTVSTFDGTVSTRCLRSMIGHNENDSKPVQQSSGHLLAPEKKATIPPSVNMTYYGAEKHPLPPQVVQRSERERAPKLRIWQSIRFQNIRWHKGEWKKTTIVLAPPASWRDASFQNSKDSATVTFRLGIWRSYVSFSFFSPILWENWTPVSLELRSWLFG